MAISETTCSLGSGHSEFNDIFAISSDSHITYFPVYTRAAGWLEPLLDRIAANQSNVVAPVIDVIDDKTMQYKFGGAKATNVGGFHWNLQFDWHGIPEREMKRRKSDVEPVRCVAVALSLL